MARYTFASVWAWIPCVASTISSAPSQASTDPAPERTSDVAEKTYQAFAGVVREIAASGRLRTGSGDSAAQALWMACHGVVALLIARPGFDWVHREELMQVTLDGLLNGLVID